MAKYEYQRLVDDHIEDLMDQINKLGKLGWKITATIQEHGYTKVILEKETI